MRYSYDTARYAAHHATNCAHYAARDARAACSLKLRRHSAHYARRARQFAFGVAAAAWSQATIRLHKDLP